MWANKSYGVHCTAYIVRRTMRHASNLGVSQQGFREPLQGSELSFEFLSANVNDYPAATLDGTVVFFVVPLLLFLVAT